MNRTNKQKLKDLYKIYVNCDSTNPLYIDSAKQFVTGHGNSDAKVVFVGEAPGDIEEQTGLPFQGRSGKLLRVILQKYDFCNKTIFVTNVVKFRLPGNRKPTEEEIKTHYDLVLLHELTIINPEIIVAVGAVAAQVLLEHSVKMSNIHGKKIIKNNKIIFPLFHPAYILRNMNLITVFEDDIKELRMIVDEIERVSFSLYTKKDNFL